MKSDDFDVELEKYLDARKRSRTSIRDILARLWPPRKVRDVEQSFVSEKKSVIDLVKEKKEQVVAKFKSKDVSAIDHSADIKEVAKIALRVIRRLPDEELKRFKESAEFEQLKEILRKHELIRKDV